MDLGDVAGLIAAIAFVVLVALLAVPLVKLGRVLDEARTSLRDVTEHSLPILDEAATTVAQTNAQLVKVDTITTNAAQVTETVSALTNVYAAVLGAPAVKIASFFSGLGHATRKASGRFRGGAA